VPVSGADKMRKAVREAVLSDSSVILEVAVDPAEYVDLVVKV